MKKVSNLKSVLGIMALVFSGAFFIYILKFAGGADIWYDEVFSLMFAKGSVSDIVRATARDVHPPLYYIYLKAFTFLFTKIMGEGYFFIAAKSASLIPFAALLIVDIVYIRKRFGLFASGVFSLFLSVMPQIPVYYLEIRMYSLSLLFVTLLVLVAERLVNGDVSGADSQPLGHLNTKDVPYREKRHQWLYAAFWLLGILTAYTQYYACIAVIGIYVVTIILLLLKRDDCGKKGAAWILFGAILSCVMYLPWIPVLLDQMKNISGSYWIQPLTIRSIAGCVKFVTLPEGNTSKNAYVCVGLMLFSILAAFLMSLKKGDSRKKLWRYFFIMTSPAVFVVISGFILSALGTPIFVYRYLIPTLGAFWLFIAIILDKAIDRIWPFLLIIPFILVGEMNIKGFCYEEQKKVDAAPKAFEAINEIPENSVIITNFDHVTAVISYYRPDCSVYLYEAPIDRLLSEGLGNITELTKDEDVKEFVTSNADVYFLGSFNSREEIVEHWKELGISSDLFGEALVERYWINFYRLHP